MCRRNRLYPFKAQIPPPSIVPRDVGSVHGHRSAAGHWLDLPLGRPAARTQTPLSWVGLRPSRPSGLCVKLDGRRRLCLHEACKGQCWLQVCARLSNPAITVTSHMYVHAVGSAQPCLGRAFLVPCASSHRARPRRHRGGQRSFPATGRFDRRVFFALGWLVWVRWSAPWPRSSKIPR